MSLVPIERIETRIFLMRGKKVMLDRDLAGLYGVATKRLNERVKRNRNRFPDDFMFQLTKGERDKLVANCDRLDKLKHSSSFPHAFTEQGVAMLSSVLNSEKAVQVNIAIMRVFVRLKEMVSTHKELTHKLEQLEKKIEKHDGEIFAIFEAIRRLMAPVEKSRRRITTGQNGVFRVYL